MGMDAESFGMFAGDIRAAVEAKLPVAAVSNGQDACICIGDAGESFQFVDQTARDYLAQLVDIEQGTV
jgi:hypothetical protein